MGACFAQTGNCKTASVAGRLLEDEVREVAWCHACAGQRLNSMWDEKPLVGGRGEVITGFGMNYVFKWPLSLLLWEDA